MERKAVESSNIASIGYDFEKKILEVEFKDNPGVFQYDDVSRSMHNKMMEAESIGAFFAANIRNNYHCRSVT